LSYPFKNTFIAKYVPTFKSGVVLRLYIRVFKTDATSVDLFNTVNPTYSVDMNMSFAAATLGCFGRASGHNDTLLIPLRATSRVLLICKIFNVSV
jgi:hypothetical protein